MEQNEILLKISQYKDFKRFSEVAENRGEKAYLVGGFVRDLFLGSVKEDIDIVVVGNGTEFAKESADALNVSKIQIYKRFGTAHFRHNQIDYEFVGARKESYNEDSRNPDVETGTFEEDISRRDFTINSMAISLNKSDFGCLIDLYNGREDLISEIIKTPLNPEITFNDDPLRILRAIRFASKLEFGLDAETKTAAFSMRERLKIISQERITDEFLKILGSKKPSIGLKLLYDTKVIHVIFPEFANLAGVEQRKDFHHKDVYFHTCEVVDNIASNTENIWLRFAALVHDIAKPQTKRFDDSIGWTFHGHEELGARMLNGIFIRLKLPLVHRDYVKKLVRLHLRPIALAKEGVTDTAVRRLVVEVGEELEDLLTLCRADITSKNPNKVSNYLGNYESLAKRILEVRERDALREFQSPVRGEEIMQVCGLSPSKPVGLIKEAIEEAILEGKIHNDYDEAFRYMLEIKDKILADYQSERSTPMKNHRQ